MTPFVWMFIKNYENLRSYIINNKSISSLIQLEYSAFSEATVPICTFVLSNFDENYAGTYLKLSEFTGGMEVQKEKVLQIISGDEILNDKNKFSMKQSEFDKIPGNPIAYWISNNIINCFENESLLNYAYPKAGISTGDNNKFVRNWFEVDFNKINFECNSMEESESVSQKWFPYNKGGSYRKWFGNNELIVNWENGGYEIKNFKRATIRNPKFHFKRGITWSTLSSGNVSFRYNEKGFLFDSKGANCLIKDKKYFNVHSAKYPSFLHVLHCSEGYSSNAVYGWHGGGLRTTILWADGSARGFNIRTEHKDNYYPVVPCPKGPFYMRAGFNNACYPCTGGQK